ncbi:hypothetical protein NQ315_003043 [Exocentrus adspersus]|uniref:RRM domain-containing protein n=1 Tax=Exocentrus adspersus TaxID=1586481 RepID=A0AAV8W5Z8_9CUCU|nr:hypothetical protein NQ315_003043 [Exocentrus adspersus]
MVKVKTSTTTLSKKPKPKQRRRPTRANGEMVKVKTSTTTPSKKPKAKQRRRPTTANVEQNRGLIYIGHIPHGFYEAEMKKYFKQFGAVTNLKVCRSNQSGRSKGYGYIEFLHPDVAKIAAETMNNYLMFKKRVVAEYVPFEKRPKGLFKGRSSNRLKYSTKTRREKQMRANSKVDEATHLKRSSARLSRLNKKLKKLQSIGIDYDLKPTDLPQGIKEKTNKDLSYTFQEDPYDSDIEIKVPVKRKALTAEVASKKLKLLDTPTTKIGPAKPKPDTPEDKTPRKVTASVRTPRSAKAKNLSVLKASAKASVVDLKSVTPKKVVRKILESSSVDEVKVTLKSDSPKRVASKSSTVKKSSKKGDFYTSP